MALSSTLIVLSLLVPILASLVYVVSTHFDGIISAIKGNQILQTFVFGSASGSLVYCLKLIWDQVWGRVYSKFRTDITIQNTDPAYEAVVDFINENHLTSAQSSMQVNTRKYDKTWKQEIREHMYGASKEAPQLDLKPNDDGQIHSFIYKSVTIQFYRKKGETLITGYSRQPSKMEHLNLSCWGTDSSLIMQLIEDAIAAKVEKESNGVSVYVSSCDWLSGFELACTRKPRDSESVILDAEYAELLLADARKFLSNSSWYHDMGIPYRRGYLLHGPPGCGKTSFALVLASELKLNICILNLSDQNMDDNAIAETLRSAPSKAIILLEDVDSVFLQRSNSDAGCRSSSISFSGLLNAIDGVAAQEGRIFLMTTNHLERLDPALIRPGRCDIKVEVKKASKHQLEKMFLRFFPNDAEKAILFKSKLPADEFSMAEIQGHMLEYGHSADSCVEYCSKLLDRKKTLSQTESIYDYLRRAGLENYASVFEFLGIYDENGFKNAEIDLILKVCPELRLDLKSTARLKMLKEEKNVKLPTSHFSTVELCTLREEFLATYPLHRPMDCSKAAPDKDEDVANSERFEKGRVDSIDRVESKNSVADYLDEWEKEHDVDSFLKEFLNGKSRYRQTQKTNDVSAACLDYLSRVFIKNLCDSDGKPTLSRYQLNQLFQAYPDRPIQCVLASKTVNAKRSNESYKLPEMSLLEVLKRFECVADYHKLKDKVDTLRALLDLYETDKSVLEKANIDKSILSALDAVSKSPSMSMLGYQILDRKNLMWEFQSFFPEHFSKHKSTLEEHAFIFASKLSDSSGRGVISKSQVDRYLFTLSEKSMETAAENAHILMSPTIIPELPSEPQPEPEEEYVYEWLNNIFSAVGDEDKGKEVASKYGKKFIEQGLATLDDLKVGPPLDNATLADALEIPKLGHRLRIIAAHKLMFAL